MNTKDNSELRPYTSLHSKSVLRVLHKSQKFSEFPTKVCKAMYMKNVFGTLFGWSILDFADLTVMHIRSKNCTKRTRNFYTIDDINFNTNVNCQLHSKDSVPFKF